MKKQIVRFLIVIAFAALWMTGEMGWLLALDSASIAYAEQAAATAPITKITLSKTSATLAPGKTLKLSTKLSPSKTDEKVVWETSDGAIATVDSAGLVAAVSDGVATITARSESGNIKATCKITVKTVPVKSVKLNTKKVTVNLFKTYKLKATISPSSATYKTVTWSSSDETIATVDGAGVVTALTEGVVTITAKTPEGKQATSKVTVKAVAVKSVKLNAKSAAISPGGTYQLKATISPSSATFKTITWTSSDEAVATVDDTGKVTGLAEGATTITARTSNGKSYSCKLTVRYIKVTSVKLSKSSSTINPMATVQLTAKPSPSSAYNKAVSWSSSDPSIATVDQEGKVTAQAKTGKVTITAQSVDGSNRKATCKVTVKITKISKISLNKTKLTLGVNVTSQLTTKISPSSAYDKTLHWKSSNQSVATVDQNGLVTTLKEGTTTITAQAIDGSKKKATCKITVKAVRVKTLDLGSALSIMVEPGETHQFTATVSPSNASYPAVSWATSNDKVATVDANGLVTAVAKGTVTITATTDNGKIKATRQIRVQKPGDATYRALILGSYNTKSAKDYMPFVNKDIEGMKFGVKNAGSYDSIKSTPSAVRNKSQMKAYIQDAFGKATDDDVSLIYLVTHGHNGKVSFEGGQSMTYLEFAAMLKPIKGQIVVVVSACHSGSFIDKLVSSKAGDELMSRISILSAAQNGVKCCGLKAKTEEASSDFFTMQLLAGIGWDYHNGTATTKAADANGDGKITVREMTSYTIAKVPEYISYYKANFGTKSPFIGNTAQKPKAYLSNPDLILFAK